MKDQSEPTNDDPELASDALLSHGVINTADLTYENVFESRITGMRWNHDGGRPVLEMEVTEKFERWEGGKTVAGGFRERWEPVPDFVS